MIIYLYKMYNINCQNILQLFLLPNKFVICFILICSKNINKQINCQRNFFKAESYLSSIPWRSSIINQTSRIIISPKTTYIRIVKYMLSWGIYTVFIITLIYNSYRSRINPNSQKYNKEYQDYSKDDVPLVMPPYDEMKWLKWRCDPQKWSCRTTKQAHTQHTQVTQNITNSVTLAHPDVGSCWDHP